MRLIVQLLHLTGSQTLTNKTLTSPTLTTPKFADAAAITDASGNGQIIFQQTSNAVNAVEITNSSAYRHKVQQ